jgi:PAS domain S-box-containing protein
MKDEDKNKDQLMEELVSLRKEIARRKKSGEWHEQAEEALEDGSPDQKIGTISNITERKAMKDALTHSHDLMRYIIEHTRSDVAVHDRDMKYLYVSQSYLDDYNVKEQDIIGKHHYDVFPDLPQKWRDVHERVLQGETLGAEDDPYYREDGSVEWTRWECRPWYEADGSIGGLIVYTEIITERKKVEESLRENEERWRRAIVSSPIPIMIHDEDDQILQLSDGWTKFSGYTIEDISTLGDWTELAYGERTGSKKEYIDTLFSIDRTVQNGEWIITAKDGSKRIWDFQTTPIGRTQGGKRVLHSIAIDVTERRKAEKIIQDSLEEKTILLKEIHHRVKNNLQIISSLLDLQSETIESEAVKDIFSTSQQRIRSMALIHEMLYKGKDLGKINFDRYISEMIEYMRNTSGLLNENVAIDLDTSGIELNIDTAIPVGLLVNELISNSYKHAFPEDPENINEGEGKSNTIDIKFEAIDDGKYSLVFRDNGVGIPEEIDIEQSSTLGLQLVGMFVEQLHGSIELDREHGTTYHIIFNTRNASTMKKM